MVPIQRGLYLAEFEGSRFSAGYCECRIAGEAHTVDLTLVPGHSNRDHMADVPIAAAIEALSGQEFSIKAIARGAAVAAIAKSLKGGPRIRITITPGTLARRFRDANLAALVVTLGRAVQSLHGIGSPWELGAPDVRLATPLRVAVPVLDREGYRMGSYLATLESPENLESPDAEWEVSGFREREF